MWLLSCQPIRLVTTVNKFRLFQFNKLTVLQLSGQTCLLVIMFTLHTVNGKEQLLHGLCSPAKIFESVNFLYITQVVTFWLHWTCYISGRFVERPLQHSDQWNWLHQVWEQRINGVCLRHRDPLYKCKKSSIHFFFLSEMCATLLQWGAFLQTAAI